MLPAAPPRAASPPPACCLVHISAYSPSGRPSSSLWVPDSATCPVLMTTIRSASAMVDSRCATMTEVRCCLSSWRAACICFSVMESRALVASSRTRIWGFLRMARANATRCFSPPLSLRPRSPTTVS
mmetsp:Transcript_22694/g.49720  ORF Transcript_22694/g.49720 Transcript_22694/m.49720 type:complete len:127 (-) Transcript_22694:820-1200(-)